MHLGARPGLVGSGAYVVAGARTGLLDLDASPAWHRGALSHPRIRLLVVRDDNTRALRLLAGAADLVVGAIPPLLVPLFAGHPELSVQTASGIGTTYIGVNTSQPVLADPGVRHALAEAIDAPALISAKLEGHASVARSWIPEGHWAFDVSLRPVAYNPTHARALLDEAGLRDPDGAGPAPRVRLALRTGTERARVSVARAIAAMLADVGVEVEVRPSESASLLSDLKLGRFELVLMSIPEVYEPHVLSWFFGSEHIPGNGREGANRWRYRNAALDAALERGRATSVRAERQAAYRDVQRLLAADLPVIPLWHEDVVVIAGPRARDVRAPRDGRLAHLLDSGSK